MSDKDQENLQKFIDLLNGNDSVAFVEFVKSIGSDEFNILMNKVTKSDGSINNEAKLIFIEAMIRDHLDNYKNIISNGG